MAAGVDGSINIDTKINSSGFNSGISGISKGLNKITGSLKTLAAAVGIAFSVAAIVNFGKAAVTAATELSNAMLGLQSIIEGQGRSFQDAQDFIQSYISDGLIPATNAITAYKNLASRGYSDEQIQQTLTALKDASAFGRQASYTMGEAVQTATEGLKNENSILVDNAGVTKNVAKMWEDYAKSIGVSTNDLTKAQKIQAEYNGIMEETRFQTGDAAKLMGTYSGQIQQLGFNFNNLKVAVGNALIPIAQQVLPGLNSIITALTRVANLVAQVTTALFGKQAAQNETVASTASAAADAQTDLANATEAAGDAAENNVAAWDELNVLQQDTASTTSTDTADLTTGTATEQEVGAGVTVSPAVQAAADKIKKIFANLKKAFEPTKAALTGLWKEFERLGTFSWDALKDFYNDFLVPVGEWVMGTGLPDFINALKEGLSKVDWSKINKSLEDLWDALAPFAINVGKGLLWFWDNVLVPLGTWTMNEVVPAFLETLADDIEDLNGAIEFFKPAGQWLWDNFLLPIAEWTGGVITIVLPEIKNSLSDISDQINEFLISAIDGVIATVLALEKRWDAVKAAGIAAWNLIKSAWNVAATWFNTNVVQPVGKFFTDLWAGISAAASTAWDAITEVWITVTGWFHDNVISPIEEAFKTSINFMIGLVEGFVNAFIDGINVVIKALNKLSFSFPDDFPIKKYAGMHFGINISTIKSISIPRLATGAVIPPRAEFAAILGDQRSGRNIEAPESLIRGIVADEIGKIDFQPQVKVVASGDDTGFIRWVKFSVEQETHRVGLALATGGGR